MIRSRVDQVEHPLTTEVHFPAASLPKRWGTDSSITEIVVTEIRLARESKSAKSERTTKVILKPATSNLWSPLQLHRKYTYLFV